MSGYKTVKVKGAILEEFRKPFVIRDFEYQVPDDWVEVQVKAVGVCGRDTVVWKGGFPNLKPPILLGHEIFGYYNGEPVAVFPALVVSEECRKKMDADPSAMCGVGEVVILGEQFPGGYADKVYVPEWNIIPLPDDDFAKYAAATCGVATLMRAARVSRLASGERVLVTGASGGVGIHGIQYLKLIGAEVYGYTRSKERAKVLEQLGIKPVTSLDFYKEVGRMNVVMELVGKYTFNDSMRSLRSRGRLVLIGNISGEPIEIKRPALFVMRELEMHGSAAYSKKEYEAAIKLIGEGVIKAFYQKFPLTRINEAYEIVIKGEILGRAVLEP